MIPQGHTMTFRARWIRLKAVSDVVEWLFFFFSPRASSAALLNLPHFSFHSSNLTNRIWTEASHAVNSHQRRLRVAEGDIYHSMCLPPRAIWNGSCCHRSLHQPVCFEGWRSQLAGSREESIVPAALVHLAMYAATSFSRLWAKRWLRKRSWPWGSRRLSRASMRLLLSRTWRGKVSLVTTLRGLFNDQSYL